MEYIRSMQRGSFIFAKAKQLYEWLLASNVVYKLGLLVGWVVLPENGCSFSFHVPVIAALVRGLIPTSLETASSALVNAPSKNS